MANEDENKPKADKPKREPSVKKDKGGKGKAKEPTGPAPTYKRTAPPRLRTTYESSVKAAMMKEFGYTSVMQVPRLVKISVNMGLGKANQDGKILDSGVEEIKAITGQAPVICKAKKDVANFKLRKGQRIGVMVTLRRERMWEFLDRLCNIAASRARLPWRVAAWLRWPRQLHHGCSRADHLSRNRVRQDRLDQGPQHQHRHDRKDGCRRPRAARAPRYAVPP